MKLSFPLFSQLSFQRFFLLFSLLIFFPVITYAGCPDWPSSEVNKQLKELRHEIKHHDDLYYNKHAPEITDSEYDDLKSQLKFMENCYPNLAQPLKPVEDSEGKINHRAFMGSLDKAKDEKDIQRFLKKAGKSPILVQPKIDGVAAELVYQEGKLVSASTRGTGDRGRDILRAVQLMPSIPKSIPDQYPEVVLHGELFARMDIGVDYSGYSSARHYVAGQLAKSEPDVLALVNVNYFPWLWVNSPFKSDNAVLNALYSIGFDLPTIYTMSAKSLKDVKKIRHDFYRNRSNEPFLMDGIVLKLDDLTLRNTMGWSSNHPNWAIAWKFVAGSTISQVTGIRFNIGRTGQITPVLTISPAKIRGEVIQQISLGSIKQLKKKNVAVGDRITVILKGDATPVFGKVINRPKHRIHPDLPDVSQYDGYTCLKWSEACDEQFLARLKWFIKQLAVPIIDEPLLRTLIANGSLRSFDQIVALKADVLVRAGLGKDQAIQVVNALYSIHKKSFKAQLLALSIPGVGKKRAGKISLKYKNWGNIKRLDKRDVLKFEMYLELSEIRQIIAVLRREKVE
ncbi:hypothetical protein EOPP23_10995 [Endozoicomonas sp. OPT23]|uniref:hypothetical protein n=1 Tax=Endozoicomonas sp. OPT23 TaxID=2072845 RepID=UPI00129AA029|nr:hypothetical protein [Endozoicomonas sp. OPT23]MRI33512.1 hypothetical protein [Endozoicomonas sp. OPT23]